MNRIQDLHKKCSDLIAALGKFDEASRVASGMMLEDANSALLRRDEKYLTSLYKDLVETAADFPSLINAELLPDTNIVWDEVKGVVAGVVKKGKISNAREFRAVLEFVEKIYSNPDMRPVIDRLNVLLVEFETGKRGRG